MIFLKRASLFLLFFVAICAGVFFSGSKPVLDTKIYFKDTDIGIDPEAYLARRESDISGIRNGLQKKIVWAKTPKEKTEYSLVYIHGFSASSGSLRPLIDYIADDLKANVFFTRLKGHGRDSAAMGTATTNDWINDYEEALAIGRAIGKKVIVIGNSTGVPLITWRAAQNPAPKDIFSYILMSPNYAVQTKGAFLLTLPWAKELVKLILGEEYKSSRPKNLLYEENWTTSYPSTALIPMAQTAELGRNAHVENIKVPTLFIFSDEDKVVKPAVTHSIAKRWGAIHDTMLLSWSGDPLMHVLSGEALSPSTIPFLRDLVRSWLKDKNP